MTDGAEPQQLYAFLDWQAECAAERRGEPCPPMSPPPGAIAEMATEVTAAHAADEDTPAAGSTPRKNTGSGDVGFYHARTGSFARTQGASGDVGFYRGCDIDRR